MEIKKIIADKAKKIKAVVLDGDGVFFSGRVFINKEGQEYLKERSHVDGQGISLLRAAGLRIALISGETSGFLEGVGNKKLNNLPSVQSGKWPPIAIFTGLQGKAKVETIDNWLKEINISWKECAAMGDDLSDYELLKKVGLAVAPAQAEEIIKNICHFVARREGGKGAIRDLADTILQSKEIDILSLDLK